MALTFIPLDRCKLLTVMIMFQGPDFEDVARESEDSSEDDDDDDGDDDAEDEDEELSTPVQQQR